MRGGAGWLGQGRQEKLFCCWALRSVNQVHNVIDPL